MAKMEREKKRTAKKDREEKRKHELRQKMSVIATQTGIENDEELYLPASVWNSIREKGGLENLSNASSDSEDQSSESEE